MAANAQTNAVKVKHDGDSREIARRGSAAPARWEPFPTFRRFMDDIEHVFDDWQRWGWPLSRTGSSWPSGWRGTESEWMPQIEVSRRNGNFVVRAELPGIKREDVDVEVSNGVLTLSGERKENREERDGGYYRSERSYGSFYRSIPLPEGTTGEDAKAEFKDGVLEITMSSRDENENRRKIEIQ